MISPILNSLAARPLWRLAPMAVIALGIMLAAVAWEAADVRAAENATSQDIIQAVVGISAMVPEDARTVEHLGTMRSGNGIVIDDQGLVLTIGYLMLEASAAAVTDADGVLVRASLVAYDHNTGFGLLRARHPLGIKPVPLGSSADLVEGSSVIVISKGGSMPVMAARVASRREFAGYWEYLLEDAIFTVPPNPQYGGAALIDSNGRLVGIGSLAVNDAVQGPKPVRGNMFVPIDALKPILSELVEKGRTSGPATRGWGFTRMKPGAGSSSPEPPPAARRTRPGSGPATSSWGSAAKGSKASPISTERYGPGAAPGSKFPSTLCRPTPNRLKSRPSRSIPRTAMTG